MTNFLPELLDLPHRLMGDRLILRPYRAGDGGDFFKAIDPYRQDLKQWVSWVDDNYPTEQQAEAYVRRMASKWLARQALILGIWTKDGQYCGGTGFHGFDWQVPSLEFGYFLSPPARGNGYGTEAIQILTDFGFRHLNAKRIWATVDVKNIPSTNLMARCGYRQEGLLLNECKDPQNNLRDTLFYGMTDTQFGQKTWIRDVQYLPEPPVS